MDASPYSAAAIVTNQATTTPAAVENNGKLSKVYPNSLFRLVTPRRLITLSTCKDCGDRIFKTQKTGGIVYDPFTDEVILTIKLCSMCVADNQSSSFSQVKLAPKKDKETNNL
uniref:Uncharacterized protein n=1 Tax=Panagrolaimus superbus TaxID=310955 RepID=A0A914YPC5_9BILA